LKIPQARRVRSEKGEEVGGGKKRARREARESYCPLKGSFTDIFTDNYP
jgi:hypothetical protein